jgi:hypothetical protein
MERVAQRAGRNVARAFAERALKMVPVVGTVWGIYSAVELYSEGDVMGGGLELIGAVPGVGDVVDFIRLLETPSTARSY